MMGEKTRAVMLLCSWLLGFLTPVFASDAERPAGHLDNAALVQILDFAHLVDCRSRFEYDVLHMKNSVHIPVATMLRDDLERLRGKDLTRPIVFYGNGEGCSESRAAFMQEGRWGYQNIFVYRSGIFNWAKERPETVLIFGEIPGGVAQQRLFAPGHYLEECLTVRQFLIAVQQPGVMVVDIRDVAERQSFSIELPNLHHYSFDHLVKLIKGGSRKVAGEKMYILDSCGMQSQWLQYILDDHNMDYAFLEGGAVGWRQSGLDRSGTMPSGEKL